MSDPVYNNTPPISLLIFGYGISAKNPDDAS
jgi:hypothetical protein